MKKLRGQSHEIELPNHFILFSYVTPVAIFEKSTGYAYQTEQYFSRTTSAHISHWEKTRAFCEKERIPQSQIEKLVS